MSAIVYGHKRQMHSHTTKTSLPKADDCLGSRGAVDLGSPLFYAIDFPELQHGQFAVYTSDIADGPFSGLSNQGQLDNERKIEGWQICSSFEAARQQAHENVTACPTMECDIYDSEGRVIHTVRNGQPIPLEVLLANLPKPAKAWWQVWK
jgi:hypothetical protein